MTSRDFWGVCVCVGVRGINKKSPPALTLADGLDLDDGVGGYSAGFNGKASSRSTWRSSVISLAMTCCKS